MRYALCCKLCNIGVKNIYSTRSTKQNALLETYVCTIYQLLLNDKDKRKPTNIEKESLTAKIIL